MLIFTSSDGKGFEVGLGGGEYCMCGADDWVREIEHSIWYGREHITGSYPLDNYIVGSSTVYRTKRRYWL